MRAEGDNTPRSNEGQQNERPETAFAAYRSRYEANMRVFQQKDSATQICTTKDMIIAQAMLIHKIKEL